MNINRVKQFWHALFSKMGDQEINFVLSHLNNQEQSLFFSMDRPTQTHCVRVARTCLKLLPGDRRINIELLIKSALLHDIGKPANTITTLDKVIIVLMAAITPKLLNNLLARKNSRGRFKQVLLAHFDHPLKGAQLARQAQLPPELVFLIEHHHRPQQVDEPIELTLLRQADELN